MQANYNVTIVFIKLVKVQNLTCSNFRLHSSNIPDSQPLMALWRKMFFWEFIEFTFNSWSYVLVWGQKMESLFSFRQAGRVLLNFQRCYNGNAGILLQQTYSLHLRQNFGTLKMSIKTQFNYLFCFINLLQKFISFIN